MNIELWLRVFLGIYGFLFFFFCLGFRVFVVWRRTGIFPVVLGKSDNVYDFVGKLFKATLLLLAVFICTVVIQPEWYGYFGPLGLTAFEQFRALTILLLGISLSIVVVAQANMGTSFRIGIDFSNRTSLASGGLFRYSRNPIYLGMMGGLIGLFALLPNVLTVLILICGWMLLQIQIRLEEEFLERTHGEEFRQYRRQVRRWL